MRLDVEKISYIFGILKKYRDLIYIVMLIILYVVISRQSAKIGRLEHEIDRQENNRKALTEQISNYIDEIGRANAEKHAYQLTQDELRDSIGLLKKKNTEYVSYINTDIGITDTVTVETVVVKEIEGDIENGSILVNRSDTFGRSRRSVLMDIPYSVSGNTLYAGNTSLTVSQDIFVEGWLEKNRKTNETFIHLRSDYPGLTFNSGMGIVAETGKKYERSVRKTRGIGVSIGPNVGVGYDFSRQKFIPTVGFGLTVGFTYTPRLLQW